MSKRVEEMRIYFWIKQKAANLLATLLLAASAFCSTAALAEYRVGVGDVVEISVVGLPDLERRTSVELDGTISLPLAGSIHIDGRTLAEVRAEVRSAFSSRSYARIGPDGMRSLTAINPDDVLVSIAAYRPVFVKGDVASPGEYPYRARMTIREVVALAKGYLAYPLKSAEDVLFRDLDVRGEVETLWIEATKERARIWRSQVMSGDSEEGAEVIGQSVPMDAPVKRAVIAAIEVQAARQVETLEAAYSNEVQAIKGIIEQLDQEIATTTKQLADEEQSYKIDQEELDSLGQLQQRGVVTSQRFSDARRAVVFSSTRVLQTASRLSDLKRLKMERELQAQKMSSDRKVALFVEVEAATARLAEVQAKLRSATEKLQFGSMGRGRIFPAKGNANMVVYRRVASKTERISATEDSVLEPGDVVEVSLETGLSGAAAQGDASSSH